MENRIKTKRVGEVDIFELWGNLEECLVKTKDFSFRDYLAKNATKAILLNIQRLKEIKTWEIWAQLVRDISGLPKHAILSQTHSQRCYLSTLQQNRQLPILYSEYEAAVFFARELAVMRDPQMIDTERRQHPRLKTVLPLRFWFENGQKVRLDFFAVVTNLSEGGLFAEFIESVSEDQMKENFDLYALQLLNLELYMPHSSEPLRLHGKMVHGDRIEDGIGVEFYDAVDERREYLVDWLGKHFSINEE